MRFVRWCGVVLLVIVLVLAATVVLARFHDGPLAIIPGGPLLAGELVSGPEPDWTFARDIQEIELQLEDPPRSRTIWLLVHDHRLFAVSGYMNTAVGRFWKQWPAQAERDGRAVVRIDGKRYERKLVRLTDRPTIEALAAEARRKYQVPLMPEAAETGDAWFFAVLPRDRSSSAE